MSELEGSCATVRFRSTRNSTSSMALPHRFVATPSLAYACGPARTAESPACDSPREALLSMPNVPALDLPERN